MPKTRFRYEWRKLRFLVRQIQWWQKCSYDCHPCLNTMLLILIFSWWPNTRPWSSCKIWLFSALRLFCHWWWFNPTQSESWGLKQLYGDRQSGYAPRVKSKNERAKNGARRRWDAGWTRRRRVRCYRWYRSDCKKYIKHLFYSA